MNYPTHTQRNSFTKLCKTIARSLEASALALAGAIAASSVWLSFIQFWELL